MISETLKSGTFHTDYCMKLVLSRVLAFFRQMVGTAQRIGMASCQLSKFEISNSSSHGSPIRS